MSKVQIEISNFVDRGVRREEVVLHDLKGNYKIYIYPIKNAKFRDHVYSRIRQLQNIQ